MNLTLSCTFSFFRVIESNMKTQIRMVRDFWDTLYSQVLLMTFCLWFVVEVAHNSPPQARAASGDVRRNGRGS